jgi:hypothetical protein
VPRVEDFDNTDIACLGWYCLSCEAAPVGDGKQFGKAHHDGKTMNLPCVYCLFGGVCAMHVRWSVLDASSHFGDKHFDVFGCFVVEFVW